jgi:ketol-acid reductoisomerase
LNELKITIIGFGNQAKAWALNLRDSGLDVNIWLRPNSESIQKIDLLKLKTHDPSEHQPSIYALLIPDNEHLSFLQKNPLPKKSLVITAHGYSLYAHNLAHKFPDYDFLLMAPKAIGSELRFQYELKGEIAAFYSLEFIRFHTNAESFVKFFAQKLGITKGPFTTTAVEETKADLFSEQAILCSILPYCANLCYEILREKGYSKELSYYECFYEVYLIAKVLSEKGPEEFFKMISPNALIGSDKGMKKLLDDSFKTHLRELFSDIESDKFNTELTNTNLEQTRNDILNFWKSSELSQTFKELHQ